MDMTNFPPMYTIQLAEATRERQLALWCQLVVRSALGKDQSVAVVDLATFPAFSNAKIQRSLDDAGRRLVGDALVERQLGQWEDAAKTRLLVSSRTIEAWASTIYEWARDTGRLGTAPSTVYEVYAGDDAQRTPLEGLHPDVCLKALKVLEQQGKAVVIVGDSVDSTGVKFV